MEVSVKRAGVITATIATIAEVVMTAVAVMMTVIGGHIKEAATAKIGIVSLAIRDIGMTLMREDEVWK